MRTIDVIGKGTWVCRTEGRNTQSYSLFVSTLLCRDKLLTDSPYKQRIPAVDVSLHANTVPAELMTVSVIVGAWRYSGPRATQSPFGITPSPNYHFKKGLYLMVLFFFFLWWHQIPHMLHSYDVCLQFMVSAIKLYLGITMYLGSIILNTEVLPAAPAQEALGKFCQAADCQRP